MIATEALILGAQKVQIHSTEEWLTVVADKDWLEHYGHEAFHTITPFPEAGVNGMLAEVLAVAFSSGVATATPDEDKVIKGEDSPLDHPAAPDMARAVAIRRQRGLQPLGQCRGRTNHDWFVRPFGVGGITLGHGCIPYNSREP